jgi:hypothetical protein
MATYSAPANLKDFDRAGDPPSFYDAWHNLMSSYVDPSKYPAAFDSLKLPAGGEVPQGAAPQWFGLPRTVKRYTPSISQAAALVEHALEMGSIDPLTRNQFTDPFLDARGNPARGQWYRPQDEYLEWVTRTDSDGVVASIEFTAEGPEYWDMISRDEKLLVALYQEICKNKTVKIDDLVFAEDLTWSNPNEADENGNRITDTYPKGSYNPYNRWNAQNAVHLTQTANTLGAEIHLAKDATRPYGTVGHLVTDDPDLVCCAAYGGINRMSDPTIGHAVNQQVVKFGKRVALRNPIGLYIKGLVPNQLTLDGAPFADQDACWTVLRPEPANVTDMIVRAKFEVPAGQMYKGRQLRVGDLAYMNDPIKYGGQIADFVQMTLYALTLSGALHQKPTPCVYSPCVAPGHPEYIYPVKYGDPCHATPNEALKAAGFRLPSAKSARDIVRVSHR